MRWKSHVRFGTGEKVEIISNPYLLSYSDTLIAMISDVLIKKAKYCEENFATPINKVKGKAKKRKNNMKELSQLDVILSDNYIGKIVNLSQIINSYLNDAITKGKSVEEVDEIYQISSRLSSLSQIEIDKSKKVFDNVNMRNELKKIRNMDFVAYEEEPDKYQEDKKVKKMVVPMFFKYISQASDYRVFKEFNTPLDKLQNVLVFGKNKKSKNVEMGDLLKLPIEFNEKPTREQVEKIYKIISSNGRKIKGLRGKSCKLNEQGKQIVKSNIINEIVTSVSKFKIRQATVLNILRRSFKVGNDDLGFSQFANLTLNVLMETNKEKTLICFKTKDNSQEEVLIPTEAHFDIDIFGDKYKKTLINQAKTVL